MKLTQEELQNKQEWQEAGIVLPHFNREEMIQQTKEKPVWIHLGPGNIFRAYPAMLMQKLLNDGKSNSGIIVAEGYDYEVVDLMQREHDNLSLLVTLKADGSIEKTVVASVAEALKMNREDQQDFSRLQEIFTNPGLQMVSLTITEKGYSLKDSEGNFTPSIIKDFKSGPYQSESYMGKVASLCYERFKQGGYPVAMVSMDNMSHNGKMLYQSIHAFAEQWVKNEVAENEFLSYIENPKKVSFPWSMIDKITPRPDESVKEMLLNSGFEDVDYKVTQKNTYIAPFVNAEETEYLVIEDCFPNGRPPLEEAGVIFTNRDTVNKVETMKVTTCLNPLHTALAIFGCLLGYERISEEMKNPLLLELIEGIGYKEGLPVVVNPEILDPKEFLDEVIQKRFPNPFIPDTPQRIASDTSQKLSIRFGKTIQAYVESEQRDPSQLTLIPLVLAGWIRYLMGVDDTGKTFEKSPDPLMEKVSAYVSDIQIGSRGPFTEQLRPLLSNSDIFGVDLFEVKLAERVADYFAEMVASEGAIVTTLEKYLKK